MARTKKTNVAINPETWIHPFERADLGRAPFQVVGYAVEKYQACPGAPIQVGTSCDLCGMGIMHVYRIQGADGRVFKVGCDCVYKTHDTALIEAIRKERRAAERAEQDRLWRAEREEQGRIRARNKARLAEHNAEHLAMVIEGALVVSESPNAGSWEKSKAECLYRELTTGERAGFQDWEWQLLTIAYPAALLPASRHIGQEGERLRGLVCRYEHGATVGIDSPFGPSTLARFRVIEGPYLGAVLIWKTAGSTPRKGATVRLTGTVKGHGDYQGTLQTNLTRCKVETLDETACVTVKRW